MTAPSEPAKFKLVPVEPDDTMQAAGAQAIRYDTTVLNKLWTGNAVYRAMLAAAPASIESIQQGWRNVVSDGLPPCDGETVFIGINTNGFAACFNEVAPHGACSMRGPELSTCQMSGLEWWRELDRPVRALGRSE